MTKNIAHTVTCHTHRDIFGAADGAPSPAPVAPQGWVRRFHKFRLN